MLIIKRKILQELIENMESIGSKISEELTLRFKAQYAAFMENDYDVAIGYINQAIEMNEKIFIMRGWLNLISQRNLVI